MARLIPHVCCVTIVRDLQYFTHFRYRHRSVLYGRYFEQENKKHLNNICNILKLWIEPNFCSDDLPILFIL